MLKAEYLSKQAIERIKRNIKNEDEVIKFVEAEYKKAIHKINRDIVYYLDRIATNNQLSMTEAKRLLNKNELKDFKMSLEEYIRKGSGKLDEATIKALENASNRVHISRLQAMEYEIKKVTSELFKGFERGTKDLLLATYQDTFYHTLYDLQSIAGEYKHIGSVNVRKLETLFTKEWSMDRISLSKRFAGNRELLNETLRRELYQNIVGAKTATEAINNLAAKVDISKRSARRLIQTENNVMNTLASNQSYKEFGVKEYEILSTLDSRTCKICADMDGSHFPVSDMEIGLNAPSFHPYCRCTTIPYLEHLQDNDTRFARDSKDNAIMVDGNMKYSEWEKTYIRR